LNRTQCEKEFSLFAAFVFALGNFEISEEFGRDFGFGNFRNTQGATQLRLMTRTEICCGISVQREYTGHRTAKAKEFETELRICQLPLEKT